MMQYYYMKIFFYGKKVFTAGSKHKPAVMGAHHQRLAHASLPVYEPTVMNPAITAGSGSAITIDLNPTVPKTVGDALLEPAVIGVAVVVIAHTKSGAQSPQSILQGDVRVRRSGCCLHESIVGPLSNFLH